MTPTREARVATPRERARSGSVTSASGSGGARSGLARILGLHRAAGNAAVRRSIQAKFEVSRPDDEYEHEADRVAERVVQRKAASCSCGGTCDECGGTPAQRVQRVAAPASSSVPAPSTPLDDCGRGEALDRPTRGMFEARLGHDLGDVRVHRDEAAAAAARGVGALAFTVGRDVVFAPGRYAPGTIEGDRLLAHELTHVIQQRTPGLPAGFLQRKAAPEQTEDCTDVPTSRRVDRVVVDQETPQSVTVFWNDGVEESVETSTGKGHCCLGPEAVEGAACSETGSRMEGTNCTPVGERRVNARLRVTSTGVEFWTEFHSGRSIALHEYSPVDGTPLSHGCVRLDRDIARRIWCGSREGRTRVIVEGLARPRCDHPELQREWLGDFEEAAMRPPDGERFDARTQIHIDIARRALRSALGVGERELTRRLTELETATGGFARGAAEPATLGTVAAAIPRCVPTLTTEEARLDLPGVSGPGVPRQILAASGFDRFASPFERALSRTVSKAGAVMAVEKHGRELWEAAKARAQATAPDTDDRPLYWARLEMARSLRTVTPAWLKALDPDQEGRARAELLDRFERASRGLDTAAFARDKDVKRIVVSGFDPFGLAADIRRGNPSGAAVLALDGRELTTPDGIRGRVEGAVFPVRFADFNAGVVERFFGPFITGRRPADLIMTISMGISGVFELEEFAGRRRSAEFPENLGATGGGTETEPIVPPGLGPGAEFLQTTMPSSMLSGIRGALGRSAALPAETEVRGVPPGETAPVTRSGTEAIREGHIAVAGAGGGFLSNEIFYRTLLLVRRDRPALPMIHLHTPLLTVTGEGIGNQTFIRARDQIVQTAREILITALAAL